MVLARVGDELNRDRCSHVFAPILTSQLNGSLDRNMESQRVFVKQFFSRDRDLDRSIIEGGVGDEPDA